MFKFLAKTAVLAAGAGLILHALKEHEEKTKAEHHKAAPEAHADHAPAAEPKTTKAAS